ncbi:MAG: bi-domain-containing oxidoreductase, partial [Streptosporangiales bacterium]|nr:bi-domain-containing oxidoreductase [Streptosporangiales bacterium]
MKQVAQNYRSGELTVLDVPRPACSPGGVLVRSLFSLISTGTELMKVGEAKLSLVGKARARPDQVRKVVDSALQQGAVNTYKKVMNRLDSYTPLGYSLCGVVTDVGAGADEFSVGQVVACAGNEYALHAEYNWVPVNMCVPVPDGVPAEQAAFATVGAIAMHGVRRSEVQLGDAACVVGLGLVGQLAVRLLVASGVRVFGLDVVPDRCRQAEKAGAILCAAPNGEDLDRIEHAIAEATASAGVDHVLIAAGGPSNGPVEVAARLARDRARVVDIGKTKLDLPWNAYYDKELDVRFSRSYGPGRYDERYEVEGVDYPIGYVRWTERRNLACFLDLIAREQLDVGTLVARVFPIADAADAYQQLRSGTVPGVGFLFEYPEPSPEDAVTTAPVRAPRRTATARPGRLRIGFVGAGNYASSMLLPFLAKEEWVALAGVATQRSLSAATAQRRFGFESVSTDADAVLDDTSLDAVFVVTRHSTHADLTCRALERGHTVFVEKPLALTDDELDRITGVVASTGNDRVMVGFNRRFAPLFTELRDDFGAAPTGAVARYLVNAGRLEAKSWYLSGGEGTRFVGEGGHFVDTLGWWFDSPPVEVYALGGPEPEDVSVTLRFANGSVGQVAYLTGGSARFPKETFDATARGRSARLDNFQRAALWVNRRPKVTRARG